MSGFAKDGVAIVDGQNLAIAGLRPSGVAAQGQVIWRGVQWQLLVSIQISGTGFSPSMNTTGANLLVAFVATGVVTTGMNDNQSNIWTQAVGTTGGAFTSRIYYCINPTTSTTHNFNYGGTFPAMIVAAFKLNTAIAVDQTRSANAPTALTVQLGSLTPLLNSLIVSGCANNANIGGIDSVFNIIRNVPIGANYAVASAYKLPSDTSPVAPTWSLVGNPNGAFATMLSFIPSPWQLLAHVNVVYPVATTQPIDTTDANLIVIVGNNGSGGPALNVTDSLSNIWTIGPSASSPSSTNISDIRYCINPTTGANHTFTMAAGLYDSLIVMAFKGPSSVVVDQLATASSLNSQVSSIALPSRTPSGNNSLIITGIGSSSTPVASNPSSVSSGFSIVDNIPNVGNVNFGTAAAYLVQGTAAAVAPTWTAIVTGYLVTTLISFRPYQILDGLTDFWPMNEGSGTTFNNVVNPANPMTAQNITWAQSFTGLGPTPQFNGTTSGATSAQNNTLDGPFSACFALVTTSNASAPAILRTLDASSNSIGWQIVITSGNDVSFYIINTLTAYAAGNSLGAYVTVNIAHYICVTYDGSGNGNGFRVYIDGTSRSIGLYTNTFSGSFLSNVPVLTGMDETGSSRLSGTIANARIYNRVLTQAEITALSATFGR